MPEDVFPDPYGIVESAWVDDVTKNGQIYNSAIYIYRRKYIGRLESRIINTILRRMRSTKPYQDSVGWMAIILYTDFDRGQWCVTRYNPMWWQRKRGQAMCK